MTAAHRWTLILASALLALCCAGIGYAQTPTRSTPCNPSTPTNAICVHWAAVEQFVDGTPIVLPVTYRVEQKTGTTWSAVQTVTTTRAYLTGLAPGAYTFRVVAIVGPKESAPSNEAGRAVEHPTPTAPVIQVVEVVIGSDHSPVFTVLKDGSRSATIGGLVPVGTACDGPVLFRYRGRDWRRPVTFKPWGVSSTARVAAPCA